MGIRASVWIKLHRETWFPLMPGYTLRFSDHEFRVKECPIPKEIPCAKCRKNAEVMLLKCHHAAFCGSCAAAAKSIDKCPACGEKPLAAESIFWGYAR